MTAAANIPPPRTCESARLCVLALHVSCRTCPKAGLQRESDRQTEAVEQRQRSREVASALAGRGGAPRDSLVPRAEERLPRAAARLAALGAEVLVSRPCVPGAELGRVRRAVAKARCGGALLAPLVAHLLMRFVSVQPAEHRCLLGSGAWCFSVGHSATRIWAQGVVHTFAMSQRLR